MMTRHPDILFMTEYIKNVLYFATVKTGKVLKSSADVHYFCTDNELVYENYYSDFGPLNLGCVYKFCKTLDDKLKSFLNKQTIVYYTAIDPKKKANAAFLLGCYGVLYLSLLPRDALKPLMFHGQSYRPFQDATQGESVYTISVLDCLYAIKKARELDFFNFQDFNYAEYERLDRIQGGDLNWIVPGKFLAFIGPVDYSVSLYHPPEMYIEYFKENNVKIVIRLNKRMYDANVFNNAGIVHYDLFFPDGSCPPRHILLKFLQIAEAADGAIAVHCKAGLGRTGSLIGCYLIKHYHMTAHEAIGWMRICRPGSVIGHQQGWLEHLEPWLIKQGNLYRKRTFQDIEKFPIHEFGIYSLTEKVLRQKPMVAKPVSPPPPMQRQTRSDITPAIRPQASKFREAPSKVAEKEQYEWRVKSTKTYPNSKVTNKNVHSREQLDVMPKAVVRRSNGAGEPRTTAHSAIRANTSRNPTAKLVKDSNNDSNNAPIPTFRTTQGPLIKTLTEAKNFLMKSSMYGQQREKQLGQAISITPHYSFRPPTPAIDPLTGNPNTLNHPVNSTAYSTTVTRAPLPRRRLGLGRSPSPSPNASPTRLMDHTRATNTTPLEKFVAKDSKTALKEALSRLKLTVPVRDGSIGAASIGAASLGARRSAPAPAVGAARRAPSVRSDERPLATQGDMLNSIKFQKRYRDTLNADRLSALFNEKLSNMVSKDKPLRLDSTKGATAPPKNFISDYSAPREKLSNTSKFFGAARPTSPKARNRTSFY